MKKLLYLLVFALPAVLFLGCREEEESTYVINPRPPSILLTDRDGDKVYDIFDNCPSIFNPNQNDEDGDGIGDVCEQGYDPEPYPEEDDDIGDDHEESKIIDIKETSVVAVAELNRPVGCPEYSGPRCTPGSDIYFSSLHPVECPGLRCDPGFELIIEGFDIEILQGYFDLNYQEGLILNSESEEEVGILQEASYDETTGALHLQYDINPDLEINPEEVVVLFSTVLVGPEGKTEAIFQGALPLMSF